MGSWVTYGLGSLNQDLPGYVVLDDPRGLPINRSQNWQSGYLPPVYQGTRFRSTGSPVLNLQREFEEPDLVTRLERKLIGTLDRIHQQGHPAQQQLAARIAHTWSALSNACHYHSYELVPTAGELEGWIETVDAFAGSCETG